MSLEKEMLSVILKDLPNQTSGVLKSYLDTAENDKKELKRLQDLLDAKNKSGNELLEKICRLEKEINNLTSKIKAQEDLDTQQDNIKEEQRILDLTLLQGQLASQQRENIAIMDLCKTVFRNPTFIRTVNDTVPVVSKGGSGSGYVNPDSVSSFHKMTTTTEEFK